MGRKIYYGLSDGQPLVMTCAEGWWNVDGTWIAVHPAQFGENFHEISKAHFDALNLPELPPSARITPPA
jgi:hypothetical protein